MAAARLSVCRVHIRSAYARRAGVDSTRSVDEAVRAYENVMLPLYRYREMLEDRAEDLVSDEIPRLQRRP